MRLRSGGHCKCLVDMLSWPRAVNHPVFCSFFLPSFHFDRLFGLRLRLQSLVSSVFFFRPGTDNVQQPFRCLKLGTFGDKEDPKLSKVSKGKEGTETQFKPFNSSSSSFFSPQSPASRNRRTLAIMHSTYVNWSTVYSHINHTFLVAARFITCGPKGITVQYMVQF
ncbi:hypothetical protein BO99DRAFT_202838 [Aspergillus violaceofuscus CBS 115571]|uniref:Uncharacterized protein n=1 Tax=Aspergillus violaceofuscus (strain CBS 115571) TaxID=1450538 RepID=A0A2V5HG29_ASPV1|nr:hypothetical protein BO99DRAFT_202838 [Aspergillus violaceofuscus CBS 115571]